MSDLLDTIADIKIDPASESLVVEIDTDAVDAESLNDADKAYKEIQDMYFNEEFMKQHPTLATRLQQEVYSLYVLIKMRKSDEIIHDLNVKSIAASPSNASLYRALNQTQASILAIQRQIDDKVKDIQNILKQKQLELSFDEQESQEDNQEENKTSFRGSKAFIKQMQKQINEEPTLFDNQKEESV